MSVQTCPRCAGSLRTRQVDNLLSKYCDHCGSLPFATDVKTGRAVTVDRSGAPTEYRAIPAELRFA
jgi:Zn-finger nucleic acid-binding protein